MSLNIWLSTLLMMAISTISRNEAFSPRWKETPGMNDVHPCAKPTGVKTADNMEWTYFTLSMSWPATFCLTKKDRKCEIPENITSWSIHGLWPSYSPGFGPEGCDSKTAVFDSSKVKNIEDDLNKYWPNLLLDEPHYSFWQHEWCTHGTCAINVTEVDDEYYYFKETIDLFKNFNPYSALSKDGIIPSDQKNYSADAIILAIQKQFIVRPSLSCYHESGSGNIYLHEIQLCINKAMMLENCATGAVWNSSWKCEGDIQYPPIKHNFKN